jgi:hypothetical protein
MPSLIEVQLEVLLARDARGLLTATRDPAPRPAPRLFLGRSREANVWAVRGDVDPSTRDALERLCAAEPTLVEPRAGRSPACRERVRELLAPIEVEHRGPAYVLPEELPRDDRAREVTARDGADWLEAFPWLAKSFDALAPVAIAFDAGRPAAVCHSPRGCTALAAEAGVETLEPFRGRGLATAAVACWARAIQRSGRLALYSTSWQNAASQRVARRLSARLYGEDWHLA